MPARKPIKSIRITDRTPGALGDNRVTYSPGKAMQDRVDRVVVYDDGRVHVYAGESVGGAVVHLGERRAQLTWNDSRTPARGEGQLDL